LCNACGLSKLFYEGELRGREEEKGILISNFIVLIIILVWIKLCKQEKKKSKHKKPSVEPCSAADTETSDKYTLSFLLC
jgi:hypothetical protein